VFDRVGSKTILVGVLLVLGASGIVAQTVLLRELLILFAGNELSLGIIFGAWVVSEALGSLAAGRGLSRLSDHGGIFVFASLFFYILFPAAIYLARTYKPFAGIPAEFGIGFGQVICASFLVLLPVGFLHGFLFITACSLYVRMTGNGPAATGRVYFWETVGTIGGGVAVSYLFIPFLNSFQSSLLTALAGGLACMVFVGGFRKGDRILPGTAAAIFCLLVLVILASGGADQLKRDSLKKEWEGKNIVAYRNSFYQNISVVKNEGQYTFFTNGNPLITTPVPDISYVEEFVHLPLLAHPSPKAVLVLGGGGGGVIAEILKYKSVKRIDYAESDPELLKAIRDFPTPLTNKELGDPRVRLHFGDPRLYLKETPARYDVVFLNLPSPQTLQANRLFTRECFRMVKGVMTEGGIFAVPVTGSLIYYNLELKKVNASLLATLTDVFPHHIIVPGDTNFILSSFTQDIDAVTAGLLASRLTRRDIAVKLMTPEHLEYLLEREKADWLRESLRGVIVKDNGDFSPKGLYYNMAYRNRLFTPQLKGIFNMAGRMTLPAAFAIALGSLIILFPLGWRYPGSIFPLIISGTGFSAMIFELLLFFAFQVLYGNVFYMAGLLTSAFMGGIAAGSLAVTSFLSRFIRDRRIFLYMEGGIVIFALLLSIMFSLFTKMGNTDSFGIYLLILFLLFVAGLLTGMEFPLAVRLHSRLTAEGPGALEQGAGLIYGADLVGGFLGGLLGGALLLPVLGFVNCSILVAVLKSGTLLLAAFTRERIPSSY